ncbi:hypothetical protein ABZ911_35355, partial [Nonomuraea sp. NPDC046570]
DELGKTGRPAIVCLQAGNINTGAVDPIAEVCALAREHAPGAWVHVDGAIGLWAAASRRLRPAGLEPMAELVRAIIEGATHGFIKIIADLWPLLRGLGGGRVLGTTIVAPRAGLLVGRGRRAVRHRGVRQGHELRVTGAGPGPRWIGPAPRLHGSHL